MRFLFVSPVLPSPPRYGAQRRIHGIMTALSQRRHHVHLLALASPSDDVGEALQAARAYCSEVEVIRNARSAEGLRKRLLQVRALASRRSFEWLLHAVPAMQRAVDAVLLAHRFDAVIVEFPFQSSLRFEGRRATAVLVLDEHNIEYDILRQVSEGGGALLRRLYNHLNWRKLRKEEEGLWRSFDGIALTSEEDAEIVRRTAPRRPVAVVPNAVDVEYFRPSQNLHPALDLVLFFGAIAYYPNTEGLAWFLREIWPSIAARNERARLRIVGPRPPPSILAFRGPRVEVTGFAEDLRFHIAEAAVVIAPLLTGGGTRLKILEAMAMARPVVSTTLGAQGIAVEDRRHIVLANSSQDFAEAVVRVLDDAGRGEAMGQAGRSLVEARYSWSAAAERLEGFVKDLSGART